MRKGACTCERRASSTRTMFFPSVYTGMRMSTFGRALGIDLRQQPSRAVESPHVDEGLPLQIQIPVARVGRAEHQNVATLDDLFDRQQAGISGNQRIRG